MKTFKKRVLVSCSSNKIQLLKSLKNFNKKLNYKIDIFPADMNNKVRTGNQKNFIKMPEIKIQNRKKILDLLIRNDISYIIPTSDIELHFWSKNKLFFQKKGIFICISNHKTIKFCQDKTKFYNFFTKNNLNVIPTSLEQVKTHLITKNRFSYETKIYFLDKVQRKNINKKLIFQEYISGKEFSLDCWFDINSKLKKYILRERSLIKNGLAIKTSLSKAPIKLIRIIKLISSVYEFYGPINFQFILKNKKFYFLECNPRVSGRIDASIRFGLNVWNYAFQK